ncbi:ROK family protein [Streptomyces sp. NPDC093065]|uniref:ROK family protein n=1 Tax=Streptomyces sp. NPDC093065 TaxID=3366021 RepID=UPI003800D1A8
MGPVSSGGAGPVSSGGLGPGPSGGSGPEPSAGLGPVSSGGAGPVSSGGLGPGPSGGSGPEPSAGLGPVPSVGSGPRPPGGSGPEPSGGSGPEPSAGSGPEPSGGAGSQPFGGAGVPGGAGSRHPGYAAGADPDVLDHAPALLRRLPTLLGLGVALPGPLDHGRGVLHRVTGFPEWDGFPLRDALERRLGVPVVVDKDTNAAALGLAITDAGREGGSFAYLHLGTGLGAGLVFGGGVHRGARTGAGEFGHQVVQLDGPPCTCGDRGCIEALCLAAVARGDLAEAARVLGAGAANLAGLLDIDLVLLGGRTVDAAPEAFVHGVGAVLDARARREGGHDGAVPVRLAPGGARAVAEGAAQLLLAPLFGRGDGG